MGYLYEGWRNLPVKIVAIKGLIVVGIMAIFLTIVHFRYNDSVASGKKFSNLNESFELILKDRVDRGTIVGFAIGIEGNINGNALFEIEDGTGGYVTLHLSGKIKDRLYSTEWDRDSIMVRYMPISVKDDSKLEITYSFR